MKRATVVGIALLSAVIGALLVPRVVEAGTANPVKIQDAKSLTKARVVNGYLRVDPNATFVTIYPFIVLNSGTGNAVVTSKHYIFVSGVAADGSLTLTADTDCNTSTPAKKVWQSGNETSYSFTSSVFVCGPLEVTGGAGTNWSVYGSYPNTTPSAASALQQATSSAQYTNVPSSG